MSRRAASPRGQAVLLRHRLLRHRHRHNPRNSLMAQDVTHLRNAVWDTLLDAERYSRYYSALSERHRLRHRVLRFSLFLAAIGVIPQFLELLPSTFDWISEVAALGVIAVVAWDFMAEDGRKADILHAIAVECGECELRLRHLMHAIQFGVANAEEILAELRTIETSLSRVTDRAGYADIGQDSRENDRAWAEARDVVSGRFANE